MEMGVHIDNQPFKVISSKVKSSEVYSHEVAWWVTVMQHHREESHWNATLLPITLSPGLGCPLGTHRIQI